MTLAPESIKAGRCYLITTGQVRRVERIMPDGRVQYDQRPARRPDWNVRRGGVLDLRFFAASAEHEVPCDWTPEMDKGPP